MIHPFDFDRTFAFSKETYMFISIKKYLYLIYRRIEIKNCIKILKLQKL